MKSDHIWIEFNYNQRLLQNLLEFHLPHADSFVYHDLTGYPYSREALYHSSQGELITCAISTSTPSVIDPTTPSTNPCSGQVFRVCADMKAAGCAPAIQGRDDWYRPARDGDNDGIACE